MTKNNAPGIVRENRRQLVASLLATRPRVTQREIQSYLAGLDSEDGPRLLNPNTGKPFALGTINKDVADLREEYRQKKNLGRDAWIERLLLIYEDMLLTARAKRRDKEARLVLGDIRKLLGLDAPTRTELTGAEGVALIPLRFNNALSKIYGNDDK